MSDEFPNDQWPRLRELMETGGADAVIEFIAERDDLLERRKLFLFAVSAFGNNEWAGEKDADALLAVAHAGIDESLRQSRDEEDPELRERRVNLANVLAYNMGSNLADCWEDSGFTLGKRHFKAGLALAERCLAWRETLEKGPHPFAIAWWLKGMHEVSLGKHADAVISFTNSLEFARRHGEAEHGAGAAAHEHFGIALGEGYLGIAEHLAGVDGGAARYEAALTDFLTMTADAEKRDDAQLGASQLRTVWGRYC